MLITWFALKWFWTMKTTRKSYTGTISYKSETKYKQSSQSFPDSWNAIMVLICKGNDDYCPFLRSGWQLQIRRWELKENSYSSVWSNKKLLKGFLGMLSPNGISFGLSVFLGHLCLNSSCSFTKTRQSDFPEYTPMLIWIVEWQIGVLVVFNQRK